MACNMKGRLKVTVHKAAKLFDVQLLGTQDPYCILWVDDGYKKGDYKQTMVHNDGGEAPCWTQSFEFALEGYEEKLHVEIRDSNIAIDEFIGRCAVPIRELAEKDRPSWYSVARDGFFNKNGVDAGNLLLSADFSGEGLEKKTAEGKTVSHEVSKPSLVMLNTNQSNIVNNNNVNNINNNQVVNNNQVTNNHTVNNHNQAINNTVNNTVNNNNNNINNNMNLNMGGMGGMNGMGGMGMPTMTNMGMNMNMGMGMNMNMGMGFAAPAPAPTKIFGQADPYGNHNGSVF